MQRRRVKMTWHSVESRFCPACLAAARRWQLEWRLPWIFACQRHSRLLADTCGTCGQFQRTDRDWLKGHRVPTPERCSAYYLTGERCGADLSAAPTIALKRTPSFPKRSLPVRIVTATTGEPSVCTKLSPTSVPQLFNDLRLWPSAPRRRPTPRRRRGSRRLDGAWTFNRVGQR